MSMQIFSIPSSMVPDLHEKTSPLAKYQKSGLTKLEALYVESFLVGRKYSEVSLKIQERIIIVCVCVCVWGGGGGAMGHGGSIC